MTYTAVRALLRFLLNDEESIDRQPVQNGLDPFIAFRDGSASN